MTRDQLQPGDVVYLVPVRPGAPTAAYRQPRVRVLSVGYGEATVELSDGSKVTTSPSNLARQPITEQPPAPPRTPSRPALELPPGMEEVALW